MVSNRTYCAINLIQIYPVDSAIHPSNNRVCFSRGLGSRPGRNSLFPQGSLYTIKVAPFAEENNLSPVNFQGILSAKKLAFASSFINSNQ